MSKKSHFMHRFSFSLIYFQVICVADFIFRDISSILSMMDTGDGEVETVQCEIKQIEWKISYSSVSRYYELLSPPFSVAGFVWRIDLSQVKGSPAFIEICLYESFNNDVKRDYPVECYFGLKKRDGSVEMLVSKILEIEDQNTDDICLIEKKELMRRKSEFVSGGALTIVCTLKLMTEIDNSTQPIILDEVKSLKLISK